MGGAFIGLFPCWTHQARTGHPAVFECDPALVLVIKVDPGTGRPPDVGPDYQRCPLTCPLEACVDRYVCPDCTDAANADRAAHGLPLIPNPAAGLGREIPGWPG